MSRPPAGRFGYLVLSHRLPAQVDRLVSAICRLSPQAAVLVHHDAAAGRLTLRSAEPTRAAVLERPERTPWGGFGIAVAQLRGLRWLYARTDVEWVVLISGQDYPVGNLARWERALLARPVDGLIRAAPLPSRPGWRGTRSAAAAELSRYTHRWWPLPGPAQTLLDRHPALASGLTGAVDLVRPLAGCTRLPRGWQFGLRRGTPFGAGFRCYKGSTWMALRRRAVERLLAAVDHRPRLLGFYRSCLVPDESLLATLIGNDPALRLLDTPVNCMRWTGGAHPDPADEQVVRFAAAHRIPFARKFDLTADPALFDLADELSRAS